MFNQNEHGSCCKNGSRHLPTFPTAFNFVTNNLDLKVGNILLNFGPSLLPILLFIETNELRQCYIGSKRLCISQTRHLDTATCPRSYSLTVGNHDNDKYLHAQMISPLLRNCYHAFDQKNSGRGKNTQFLGLLCSYNHRCLLFAHLFVSCGKRLEMSDSRVRLLVRTSSRSLSLVEVGPVQIIES